MTITSKKEITPVLQRLLEKNNTSTLADDLHTALLKKKIKFPLLEFTAHTLYDHIPDKKQLYVTDRVISYRTMGGNVIAGIILQHRLNHHFSASLKKACEYIIMGDEWYVCDIIGERVMGHALLTLPEKTLPVLKKYTMHKNTWIVRCVGVAGHYAIKKGLKKKYVQELFSLLLTQANASEFHTKTGIGWAAKTTAKFHPDIIRKFQKELQHPEIKNWFRAKINIGLSRTTKYATTYSD